MASIFQNNDIDDILDGKCPKGFPADILRAAQKKLVMVKAAKLLADLKSPPGNKLHPLVGDREGQWAVWINRHYRICFVWTDTATDIEITDYH